MTHPRLVPVLLIKEQDLQHHLNGRGLVEIVVELFKYLEFRLHEHLGEEFDMTLFFAKVGTLLEIEYAVLMHFYRETKAHDSNKPVHWRHDQALVHQKEPVVELDRVHRCYVIKTVKIF